MARMWVVAWLGATAAAVSFAKKIEERRTVGALWSASCYARDAGNHRVRYSVAPRRSVPAHRKATCPSGRTRY